MLVCREGRRPSANTSRASTCEDEWQKIGERMVEDAANCWDSPGNRTAMDRQSLSRSRYLDWLLPRLLLVLAGLLCAPLKGFASVGVGCKASHRGVQKPYLVPVSHSPWLSLLSRRLACKKQVQGSFNRSRFKISVLQPHSSPGRI